MKKLDILLISLWFPYPMDNGARIRIWHLLRILGECHRVHFVGFIPTENEYQYLPDLYKYCTAIDVVKRDPFWHDPRQRFSAHLSRNPRDVLRGYCPEMAQLIKTIVDRQSFDVVIASTMAMAQYALQVDATPRILEEHNFTTLWMEERFRRQSSWLHRLAGWITWQKCLYYEKLLYPLFQAVTMVSQNDLQAVEKYIPNFPGRLEVIPNGVDVNSNTLGLAELIPDTLVFNGSLTYQPNLEAMRFFIFQVLPLIHHTHPTVSLTITGRTTGVDLTWLPVDSRIRLTGYLEDVRPAVAGSWIAVTPIFNGSGTRLKILEAMALGTPVVSTTKGAEGLRLTHGQELLIADSATAMAEACIRLLEDLDLRQQLIKKARSLVEQEYDWGKIGNKFIDLVEQVVGRHHTDSTGLQKKHATN